jgi:DNA repair ATPase RecN
MHKGEAIDGDVLDFIKQVQENPTVGNRWYKSNLHVHASKYSGEQIVEGARNDEVDLIAITDHNTFEHVWKVEQALKKMSDGRPLTVLPGVEITAGNGMHIIGVFPTTFSRKDRQEFLPRIGLRGDGTTSQQSDKSPEEIIAFIEERGGISIIPHPWTSGMGMFSTSDKPERKGELLNSGMVHLMQVSDKHWEKIEYVGAVGGQWVNRYKLKDDSWLKTDNLSYCLGPINRSDDCEPSQLGEGCSWLLMSEPSPAGLKQVACEPRTRILRDEPDQIADTVILALRINGGFCDGQTFRFNEGLNCVIGPNHSGKSAVLDALRFVLGHTDPNEYSDDEEVKRYSRRLDRILGSEGRVQAIVQCQGDCFLFLRSMDDEQSLVFQIDDDDIDQVKDVWFPLELYPQNAISDLRKKVDQQLQMLDEFAGIQEMVRQRDQTREHLNDNARKQAPLLEKQEELKTEIEQLPKVEKRLKELEKQLEGIHDPQWAHAISSQEDLESVTSVIEEWTPVQGSDGNEPDPLFGIDLPDDVPADAQQQKLLKQWHRAISSCLTDLEQARLAANISAERFMKTIEPLRKQWTKAKKEHESVLSKALKEKGVASPQALVAEVEQLRSRIKAIKKTHQPELRKYDAALAALRKERRELRATYDKLLNDIDSKRRETSKQLTDHLDGLVQISLSDEHSTADCIQTLNRCADSQKSVGKVQRRQEQLQSVATSVQPHHLSRRLEGDSVTELQSSMPGVTSHTIGILKSAIENNIVLASELETSLADPSLSILVKRDGSDEMAPLTTGLSQGEQSATLLSIALMTRQMPLVIDQPEDELGYSYVVHRIVPKLLTAKGSRQVIVVTHNANIAVLGDADYVIRMENETKDSETRCFAASSGCFENELITQALLDLEGGVDAFRFRRRRYRLLNTSA